jgi:hypothetical protein
MWIQKFNRYILTTFFIVGISVLSLAQGNLQYVDQKPIHFGFLLGTNMMDFGVTPSDSVRVSNLKPGFSVGIITDLRLNRYLNLRFTPTLHFGERELDYTFNTGKQSLVIQSIPVCFPLLLKYSAERKNNYRPYLIWGGGIAVDLGTNAQNPVLLRPIDFYTEFGVGCDIYFSFFKLCPELKYSIGFNDLFVPLNQRTSGEIKIEDQRFSNALTKLTSRMLTLSFNFE